MPKKADEKPKEEITPTAGTEEVPVVDGEPPDEEEIEIEGEPGEHSPPENSKKWKRIDGERKEYKERLEQRDRDLELLRQHNAQLMTAMQTKPAESPGGDVKSRIAQLRAEKKEAATNMDIARVEELNDQIADLKEQERTQTLSPDALTKTIRDGLRAEEEQRAIGRFTSQTPWFAPSSPDFDPDMQTVAIAYDARLLAQGFAGSVDERLTKVKEYVEKKFGVASDGGAGDGKRPALPGVQGRGSPGGGGGGGGESVRIVLSEQEKHAALSMLEGQTVNGKVLDRDGAIKEYARQKAVGMRTGRA
jgi:hypothetical protein